MASIAPQDITGIVLAGGRATRMNGQDKGLMNYQGMPLVLNALMRLSPQVGEVLINANRQLGAYEAMGAQVCPDPLPDYPGPLAGFLAGFENAQTPYLVTVPCDCPHFPHDLVQRLAQGLQSTQADIAMACTRGSDGTLQVQPVFCLLKCELLESLVQFMHSGQRKIDKWTAQHHVHFVVFDNEAAFANANTPEELAALNRAAG